MTLDQKGCTGVEPVVQHQKTLTEKSYEGFTTCSRQSFLSEDIRNWNLCQIYGIIRHKDPALPACTAAYVGVHLHWNFVQLHITAISLGSKLSWWSTVSEFGLCPLTARHDKGLHLLKQLSPHLFVIFVCDILLIFATIFECHTISIVDCLLHHPKHCGVPVLQQNNSQSAPGVTCLASTQLSQSTIPILWSSLNQNPKSWNLPIEHSS